MPLVAKGWDCSWDPPDQACMKSAGYAFMVRYSSRDPSKNLTRAELDSALALGLGVCVVFQEGKTQMLRGYSGGVTDAADADAFVTGLGLAGIPLYFSADWDVQDYEQAAVNAYLDGAASVISRARTGIYGGYPAVSKALNAGKATWAWQCFAWSGSPTQWDSRAQLRQVKIDYARCGGTIDDDEARAADYGQWPRPGTTEEAVFMPAVCADGQGRWWQAGIWKSNGQVNVLPPGADRPYAVDPGQSGAKGGVGIAYDPVGDRIRIVYLNASNDMCSYTSPVDPQSWGFVNHDGDYKV